MKTYCVVPGCSNIADESYKCPEHKGKRARNYAQSQGYNAAWRTFSKAFLREHPTCFVCGPHKPATVTGHWEMSGSEMLKTWGQFLLDPRMYRALCTSCNQLAYTRLEKPRKEGKV